MKKKLKLLATGDVCKYLNVSQPRLYSLVKNYKIPYYKTSGGMIFEKEVLDDFQKSRQAKLKHRQKK
ncbi:helix-turn-helix domain-containing protein [Desulfobacter vibrioformis]|uniref:helix-turn-helix domain-containing protein n=1 Tax=Desulfobacter vibrioformis TaxID=34031 RepID=UPI000553CD28